MWRQTGFRAAGALICFAAATAGAHGPAVPPTGPTLAPRTHGFMLYLSQPLGGGGAALKPKFGLRFEQVRMTGNTGAPDGGDPMQHRSLIGWQMDSLRDMRVANMRLEFGSHMTYDVRHGGFAFQSPKAPSAPARPATMGQAGPKTNMPESRLFDARAANGSRGSPVHETFALGEMREASPSLLREVTAAAVLRFNASSGQPRPFANHRTVQGRPMP